MDTGEWAGGGVTHMVSGDGVFSFIFYQIDGFAVGRSCNDGVLMIKIAISVHIARTGEIRKCF